MLMPRFAVIVRSLLAVSALCIGSIAQAGPDYERWYTIEMLGQRSGWMMSAQTTGDATITTRSKTNLAIKRGATEIAVTFETEFVETLDHKPVSMKTVRITGAQPVVQSFTFGPTSMSVQTAQGEQPAAAAEQPLPEGEWLTPAAAGDFVLKGILAGETKVTVRSIEPLSGGSTVEQTYEVLERTNILSQGRTIPTIKCRVTQSIVTPIVSTEYVDLEGVPMRVETEMGALALVMEAATKEAAMAPGEAPEVMVSTFVKPDRRIPRARYKKLAVYTLSVPSGPLADLPQAGGQRFERIDEQSARITVDVLNPLSAAPDELAAPEFLENSSMVGAADPVIVALAAEAIGGAGDVLPARAEAIRRHIHRTISRKDLDIGFATASETVRTRQGDCTEHAVLLAATLRAARIPARIVSGLVYTDGFAGQSDIFGYHMWTQALLEQDGQWKWIDLDATLGDDTTFDATHIALAVSALSDDNAYEAMAPMATMIGRLSIRVESAE
jgi:transglutaminase-like putative cysteine protease